MNMNDMNDMNDRLSLIDRRTVDAMALLDLNQRDIASIQRDRLRAKASAAPQSLRAENPAECIRAIGFLRTDVETEHEWRRTIVAIKGALGEEGRSIAECWANKAWRAWQSTNYFDRIWSTVIPRFVGAKDIYRMAAECGWQPEQR